MRVLLSSCAVLFAAAFLLDGPATALAHTTRPSHDDPPQELVVYNPHTSAHALAHADTPTVLHPDAHTTVTIAHPDDGATVKETVKNTDAGTERVREETVEQPGYHAHSVVEEYHGQGGHTHPSALEKRIEREVTDSFKRMNQERQRIKHQMDHLFGGLDSFDPLAHVSHGIFDDFSRTAFPLSKGHGALAHALEDAHKDHKHTHTRVSHPRPGELVRKTVSHPHKGDTVVEEERHARNAHGKSVHVTHNAPGERSEMHTSTYEWHSGGDKHTPASFIERAHSDSGKHTLARKLSMRRARSAY